MLAASVSNEVWIGTGLIAAVTVLSCLGLICNRLRYDIEFITVVAGAKKLRDMLTQQLDEAGARAAEQTNPVRGGAATPAPDSDDSADADDAAGTEEIIEIQPDPEVLTPDSADAA